MKELGVLSMDLLQQEILEKLDDLDMEGKLDDELKRACIERVKQGKLVKSENSGDHMCTFFVPVHLASKQVFLGHHIKADMWIPPGGHIEPFELMEQTVRREFLEELGVELANEAIQLFQMTVLDIEPKPDRSCRRHWDWWHMVLIDALIDYDFDRGEFFEASWMPLNKAVKVMDSSQVNYIQAIKIIKEYL
jgi:8-oxo-dGTP pyrophosphatase MutT (NUDIX family)